MSDAGRILILPKGEYSPDTTYDMLDLVTYKNSSWLAKRTVTGVEPSADSPEYWQFFVKGGSDSKPAKSYAFKLPTSGWTSVAPYQQTVDVAGMVADGTPFYTLQKLGTDQDAEFAKVTDMETSENHVMFEAKDEKPTIDLDIRIEVVY